MKELDRSFSYTLDSWQPITDRQCTHKDDQVVCTLTTWERRKCKVCGFERWDSLK